MTQSEWNPEQYERFRGERQQPFFDLLKLVQHEPNMRVIDLGCGTGELTGILHRDLAAQSTLGIDSSDSMLAKSAAVASGSLRFEQADIATVADRGPFDLVVSNAALQWINDHHSLLSRLTALLAPHGQLAVQIPANDDHPSHRVAAEIAGEAPFREALGGYVRPQSVLPPEEYAALLDRLGYQQQQVRLQVYGHHLESRESVIEWVKGTLLVDYQQRLPAALFGKFLDRYRGWLLPQLVDSRPYFYAFKRILFWSRR